MAQLGGLDERMYFIRRFEEALLELLSLGKLAGTTHTYIGQEANAVGVIDHSSAAVTYRLHSPLPGHYLAFTDDVDGLLGEVMGRERYARHREGLRGGAGAAQRRPGPLSR